MDRLATVTRIIDGDTVEVAFADGEIDTIRLLGVDTPETSTYYETPEEYGIPDTPRGRDWLLYWGEKATAFAQNELVGKQVRVVTDPASDTRGSDGRLLAYIYVDGANFNQVLLKQGYARRYDNSEFTFRDAFGAIEADAQANNRGLWGFEQ